MTDKEFSDEAVAAYPEYNPERHWPLATDDLLRHAYDRGRADRGAVLVAESREATTRNNVVYARYVGEKGEFK